MCLFEELIDTEKGMFDEEGNLNLNPNSVTVIKNCKLEANLANVSKDEKFQLVRNGFFCFDSKDSKEGDLVLNRIVSLKSSFKLPK